MFAQKLGVVVWLALLLYESFGSSLEQGTNADAPKCDCFSAEFTSLGLNFSEGKGRKTLVRVMFSKIVY